MLHEFTYVAPVIREDLFKLLDDHGSNAKILAGGTDLLVNIRNGVMKPAVVVDVKKIPRYKDISYSAQEGLLIRPGVAINDILRNHEIQENFPLLQECGHDLASYQIRNRATVIGNVVNASPCSDMAPALDRKSVV